MNITTVTTKGQSTIPEEVRTALGIQAGDKTIYRNADPVKRQYVVEVVSTRNVVERLAGSLKSDVPYMNMNKARDIAGRALGEKYKVKRK